MSRVVTGNVRLSYLNVFKARGFHEGDPEKFSAVLLIPKKDKKTLDKIRIAIKEATEAGMEKYWSGKKPANLWNPLRDGDDEKPDSPEYAGMYFLTAKSDNRPILLDSDREELLDPTEMYSGCWGKANISFFPFDNRMKGVGVGLNAIMKTKDDTPFGGGQSRDEIIKGFEEDDDDNDW